MTTNDPIEASDIFLAQSDAVASGPMIWIGPLISLETGWKEGKLPEFSGIIDWGFSPILTHVLEDFSKFGDFKNLPGFLASGHEDPNPLQFGFFQNLSVFQILGRPSAI